MVDKTTSNNPELKLDQDEVTPSEKFVTAEQLNAAITARFRTFESKQSEQFSKIEQLILERATQQESKEQKKAPVEDPQIAQMRKQIEKLTADKAKNREVALRSKLSEELVAAGVNPATVKALVALHVDSDKAVSYESDESDEIVFKAQDNSYSLKDGLQQWLKTEDAKAYLIPKGAKGSGDTSYQKPTVPKTENKSAEAAASMLHNFLFSNE